MYTLERILPTFKCTFMSAAITFSLVNEFIFTKEDQSTENIKDYHRSDCAMILLMDSCKKTTPNQMAFIGVTQCACTLFTQSTTCSGQSYKQFTLVNYDSRVIVTSKLLIFTTLES